MPGFTASQYFEGWTYNGGAFALAFNCYWANLLAMNTAHKNGNITDLEDLSSSLGSASNWFWSTPLKSYPPLTNKPAKYFLTGLNIQHMTIIGSAGVSMKTIRVLMFRRCISPTGMTSFLLDPLKILVVFQKTVVLQKLARNKNF